MQGQLLVVSLRSPVDRPKEPCTPQRKGRSRLRAGTVVVPARNKAVRADGKRMRPLIGCQNSSVKNSSLRPQKAHLSIHHEYMRQMRDLILQHKGNSNCRIIKPETKMSQDKVDNFNTIVEINYKFSSCRSIHTESRSRVASRMRRHAFPGVPNPDTTV
jgi:hypothetical protein